MLRAPTSSNPRATPAAITATVTNNTSTFFSTRSSSSRLQSTCCRRYLKFVGRRGRECKEASDQSESTLHYHGGRERSWRRMRMGDSAAREMWMTARTQVQWCERGLGREVNHIYLYFYDLIQVINFNSVNMHLCVKSFPVMSSFPIEKCFWKFKEYVTSLKWYT
jgi:hypothetical protein